MSPDLYELARAENEHTRTSLRFASPLEAAAREWRLAHVLPQLRAVSTVALAGSLVFGVFYLTLEDEARTRALRANALAVVSAGVMLWSTWRLRQLGPRLQVVVIAGAICFGLAVVEVIEAMRVLEDVDFGALLIVYMMSVYVLLGLRPIVGLACVAGITLVHLVNMPGSLLLSRAGLVELMFLGVAHMVGFIAALEIERLWRADFLHRLMLTAEAERDSLTGLYNRRMGEALLGRGWAEAARRDSLYIVCIIDIDYFKQYNDRYGHLAGDQCLQRVAAAIGQAGRRPMDVAARWGGEEFLLACHDAAAGFADQLGDHVCRSIAALQLPHASSPVADHVTVSAGVVVCRPAHGGSPRAALEAADAALYTAKHGGRNRATVLHDAEGP